MPHGGGGFPAASREPPAAVHFRNRHYYRREALLFQTGRPGPPYGMLWWSVFRVRCQHSSPSRPGRGAPCPSGVSTYANAALEKA